MDTKNIKEKNNFLLKIINFIIRHKYIFSLVLFGLWITFFDTYNLIDRFKKLKTLNSLQKEIKYYEDEISLYTRQYEELFSNKDNLEKFAREQYQMLEEDEDLFIIIDE